MENVYDNFTDCYLDLAQQVYNNPDFEARPRGLAVREKLACKFSIKNPLDRLPYVPARKFSITYVIAELLWYLSAEDKTAWIANYSSFWNNISDDGQTANSAYGARIFKPHPRIAGGTFTQWDYVKEELTRDPDSRRAVIHIRTPWDSVKAKLDVPCTLSLQFFIRDEKLQLVVHMRSSDLILGIAYDIPAFTLMQELMAAELGVGMGTYTHISNSLHIYESHFGMVEEMISRDACIRAKEIHVAAGPMPAMPSSPPTDGLYQVESILRSCGNLDAIMSTVNTSNNELGTSSSYWSDWVKILAAHRCSKLDLKKEKLELIASTSFAGYQQF